MTVFRAVFLLSFLIATPFITLSQRVKWDLTGISEQLSTQRPDNVYFGFYHAGYRYQDPYTRELKMQLIAFRDLGNVEFELPLSTPTEVSVMFLGLSKPVNLQLWLEPGEEVTISIKNVITDLSPETFSLSSYQEIFSFSGEKASSHLAFSYCHERIKKNYYGQSIFENVTYPGWKEHWNYSDDPDAAAKAYISAISHDMVWVKNFAADQRLSEILTRQLIFKVLYTWIDRATNFIQSNDAAEKMVIESCLQNYKDYFQKMPLSEHSFRLANEVASTFMGDHWSYQVKIETSLIILDSIPDKSGWQDIYDELTEERKKTDFTPLSYFSNLNYNRPDDYAKIEVPLKKAQRMASDYHETLSRIYWADSLPVSQDIKSLFVLAEIANQKLDLFLQERLLDTLFTVIPSTASISELSAIRTAYREKANRFKAMPTYPNANIYLTKLENDAELDSITSSKKGKVVVQIMLGPNAENEDRINFACSVLRFLQNTYGEKVSCMVLTVSRDRKDVADHTLIFARAFHQYGIKGAYVVNGKNSSFWQGIYNSSQGSIVRIYDPSGTLMPTGRVASNVPVTALYQLVEEALNK